MSVELITTMDEYEELHRLADEGRAVSVKVERSALEHILIDHSVMAATLGLRIRPLHTLAHTPKGK